MKTLELNQMETIEGGSFWDKLLGVGCGVAIGGMIATGGLLAAVAVSTCAHAVAIRAAM